MFVNENYQSDIYNLESKIVSASASIGIDYEEEVAKLRDNLKI